MTLIANMVVGVTGDERPLRRSLDRSIQDIKQFQSSASRAVARPLRATIDVGKEKAIRDIAEIDRVISRAYTRWNKPMPAMGPSASQLAVGGATGNYKAVPSASDMARMFPQGRNGLVTDMFGISPQLTAQTGERMAKDLIGGLRRGYKANMTDAREELFRGLINQQEFDTRGRAAAQALNHGLLRGIERFGDTGKLTPALHQKLVAQLDATGMESGAAFSRSMQRGIRSNAAFTAAVTAGFGLESIMRAKDNTERAAAGIRTALQTTATFAASAFGPQGMFVAAVALGLTAVVDHFATTKSELKKLREEWEKEIKGMVNAGDQLGLVNKLRLFDQGNPAEGTGQGGGFAGGFLESAAQMQDAVKRVQNAQRALGSGAEWSITGDAHGRMVRTRSPLGLAYDNAVREMEQLRQKIEPMVRDRNELIARIMNPAEMPRAATGLPAVKVQADSPDKQGPTTIELMTKHVSNLTTAWDQLRERKEGVNGVLGQMQTTYGRLNGMLETMARQGVKAWDEQTVAVRGLLGELEKVTSVVKTGINLPGLDAFSWTSRRQRVAPPEGQFSAPHVTWQRARLQTPIRAQVVSPEKLIPAPTNMDNLKSALLADFKSIPQAVSGMLMQSFGPVAAVMESLRPAMEIIAPLFSALAAPLTAVFTVVATMIEPVFRLMFPIIKAVAIGLSYLGEIIARVVAGIAQAVGGLLVGIGNLLNKLPGSIGNPIKRLGESVLRFSNGVKESANNMAATRRQLQDMKFGDTASDITGLGKAAAETAAALHNVPEFFKQTLTQMRWALAPIGTTYDDLIKTGKYPIDFPGIPSASSKEAGFSIEQVSIAVTSSSADPTDVAREVVKALERAANAYGMGTPWHTVPSTSI